MKRSSAIILVALTATFYSIPVLIAFEVRGGPEIVTQYHDEYEGGGSCKWRFRPEERQSTEGRYATYQFMKTWCVWMYPAALLALVLSLALLATLKSGKLKIMVGVIVVLNLAILSRAMWIGILSAAMSWC